MSDKHLLIGNGFNISIKADTGYPAIKDNICKKQYLKEVILPLKTNNLEKIIMGSCDIDKDLLRDINKSFHKNIVAITRRWRENNSNYFEAVNFLKKYDKIFTTNYDPLLYLSLIGEKTTVSFNKEDSLYLDIEHICSQHISLNDCFLYIRDLNKTIIYDILKVVLFDPSYKTKPNYSTVMNILSYIKSEKQGICFNDGFESKKSKGKINGIGEKINHLIFRPDGDMSIFYLHGAYHILRHDLKHQKRNIKLARLQFSQKFHDFLFKNFTEKLDQSTIVMGESCEDKKARIDNDGYLKHCYGSLSTLNGEIDVFGFSGDNDGHIIDAILQSNIHTVNWWYHYNCGCKGKCLEQEHIDNKLQIEQDIKNLLISRNWDECSPKLNTKSHGDLPS